MCETGKRLSRNLKHTATWYINHHQTAYKTTSAAAGATITTTLKLFRSVFPSSARKVHHAYATLNPTHR